MLAGCLALGSAAGLLRGLTSCQPAPHAEQVRPLSATEAQRLAGMRLQNYRDARVGLRIELGKPGRQYRFSGWIDWQRLALSLGVVGPTPAADGLVQAAPGLIATRSADPKLPATAVAGAPSGTASGAAAVRDAPEPPAALPTDRWRARPLAPPTGAAAPLDTLVSLLFTVAAPHADTPALLASSEARWLGRDTVAGTQTDVLLGPAVPPAPIAPKAAPAPPGAAPGAAAPGTAGRGTTAPGTAGSGAAPSRDARNKAAPDKTPDKATDKATDKAGERTPGKAAHTAADKTPDKAPDRAAGMAAGKAPSNTTPPATAQPRPTSLASMGGAVRYWLDSGSRLHRFEALLGADLPVRVELRREQNRPFALSVPLGGAAISPRAVTVKEAATLARLRQRDLATGGGRVQITLPTADGGIREADGWIDWRATVAYLVIRDPDRPGATALVRADAAGVASRPAPKRTPKGLPPIPPPRETAWSFSDWSRQRDAGGTYDMDLLVNEALSLAARAREDATELRRAARWLRVDSIGKTKTIVYELPKPVERMAPAGQARMRYWLDADGVLRRLELRTRSGAFAQLDLTDDTVPTLRRVPLT